MADLIPDIILADDFTGAMDAGMQLLGTCPGIPVMLHPSRIPDVLDSPWLVFNTDSRNLPPAQALDLYRHLIPELNSFGRVRYIKVDSTLRGNIGVLLQSFLENGIPQILVAPALPAGRRKTVHGIHYVDGMPLSRHELSRDPFSSVAHDRLEDVIRHQADLPVSHLDLKVIRSLSAESLAEHLAGLEPVVAADSETQEDLDRLAAALRLKETTLACGSAGLISALNDSHPAPAVPVPSESPKLILRGSPAHVGRQQLEFAQSSCPDLVTFHIQPLQDEESRLSEILKQMLLTLRSGRSAAIDAAADSKTDIFSDHPDPAELIRTQAKIQAILNRAAADACLDGSVRTLILMGGDSASGVLGALNATWIRLLGAALPLIPCGMIMDGAAKGLHIITKAGGFGEINAIKLLLEAVCHAQ